MRIHYFCKSDFPTDIFTDQLSDHNIVIHDGPIQDFPDLTDDTAEVLCVFVESQIDAAALDRFPNTKLVTTLSTGYDHIDLTVCQERGITACNVPFYGAQTVAEHAFALLLTLSRKVYDAYQQIEETGSFDQANLRGFDLSGKTIGIIGAGSIGRHAIRIARGFNMQVIVSDPHPDEALAADPAIRYADDLDDLLANSDIISLHAPYNEHTHHLINEGNIRTIKPGAYLINTARGGLVDTTALVTALRENILAGAGIDVLEEEEFHMGDELHLIATTHPSSEELKTLLENHYLIDHPHVIVTPHIAFNTNEAIARIVTTTAENITAFANGNPVNTLTQA